MGWITVAVTAILLASCGNGGGSTVDAAVADARPDATVACTSMMCGSTCCPTPAHDCAPADVCACPTALFPRPFATIIDQMDTMMRAPAVLGIGIVDGTDMQLHALVIAFDPVATPLATDITLPSTPFGEPPFAGFGYDVNITSQTTRSTYFASQGTLQLTRRCPAGVAGSLTGVTLREQTAIDDPTPHPMGCTLVVPDLTFDYGVACP